MKQDAQEQRLKDRTSAFCDDMLEQGIPPLLLAGMLSGHAIAIVTLVGGNDDAITHTLAILHDLEEKAAAAKINHDEWKPKGGQD